jgi:hypothetical protein
VEGLRGLFVIEATPTRIREDDKRRGGREGDKRRGGEEEEEEEEEWRAGKRNT